MNKLPSLRPSAYRLPEGHPPVPGPKVGVLLINLGTPDATSYWPMRRYLKEFLSDRRVIEVNPVLWTVLLNLIILTKRPFSSGEAYESIWDKERDESPLRTITRDQSAKLAARLDARFGDAVAVDWGMRYGNPPVGERIQALADQGCSRILLFPLYPQYSAATTATACDQAFRHLMKMRWQPTVRVVPPYFDDPGYIAALATSIETHLAGLDWTPDTVVASYHGLPQDYFDKGDPYHCQSHKTTRLLRERLGWPEDKLEICFQSRFGKAEWIKPYAVDKVAELAQAGKTSIAMIAPGFSADCVETLEEINEEICEAFEDAGGQRFTYIPCLNDDDAHIDALEAIVLRETTGWFG